MRRRRSRTLFGVVKEKNMYGKKVKGIARTTFVIGPDGKIKHIFNNVKAEGHAEEVLAYLKGAEPEVSVFVWGRAPSPVQAERSSATRGAPPMICHPNYDLSS